MTRMVVAILYAFLLGATFIGTSFRRKTAWEEYEAAAIIGTVFLSLNVIGTMSINMGVRESLCLSVNSHSNFSSDPHNSDGQADSRCIL